MKTEDPKEKTSPTAHAIEVAIRKKERSKETLSANYERELTEVNSELAKLRSDLITIKRNELEALEAGR